MNHNGEKYAANFWEPYFDGKESKEILKHKLVKCDLCPHGCVIDENQTGKCKVRTNLDGELIASSYGLVSSIALDPIEKKPLYAFHPGKKILSIGSCGCNFHCPFCQNYSISMEYENLKPDYIAPEVILEIAKSTIREGNIGVAFTYNEPLIGYEYVRDCSKLIKRSGLMNVLVTNGYINEEPLSALLPYIDAMNIDIKGNSDKTYKMVGGTLENVKNTVKTAQKSCHIEITTLITPEIDVNDIEGIAEWLSELDENIPYHLSRFFPRYKYSDREATPVQKMYEMKTAAEKYLNKVYLGNI